MLRGEQPAYLETLRRKCKVHNLVHHKASSRYEMMAPAILVPLALVNAALSVVSSTEGLRPNTVSYLLCANAVLMGLKEMLKLSQRAEYHASAANEYGRLAHDIERFILREHTTETPIETFQHLSARYTELMTKTIFIVPRMWTRGLRRKNQSDTPTTYGENVDTASEDIPTPYSNV